MEPIMHDAFCTKYMHCHLMVLHLVRSNLPELDLLLCVELNMYRYSRLSYHYQNKNVIGQSNTIQNN
jgi:hypothetical protein